MAENLAGKKIAILVDNGFEQAELLKPREALDHAGATTVVVSPAGKKVKGWDTKEWGDEIDVDMALSDADPADFDALQLPGGVMNPDHLRMKPEAVEFVRAFFDAGKPVAAICHAPWSLIEADVVRGRRITSWPSLKTDLKNAGAEWVDEEVVRDGNLVTSRKPDDIPAFNREMIASVCRNGWEGEKGGLEIAESEGALSLGTRYLLFRGERLASAAFGKRVGVLRLRLLAFAHCATLRMTEL